MQGHKMKLKVVKYIGEWCQGEDIEKVKRKLREIEYRCSSSSKDHWSNYIGTTSKKLKETKVKREKAIKTIEC